MKSFPILFTFFPILGCLPILAGNLNKASEGNTFDSASAIVQQHLPAIQLTDKKTGARVLVAPTLQGRVLTSTVGGKDTPSFGWINFDLVASGKMGPHINAFGGEDRIWLGPEGGQFGLYFPPGAPFDFAHWQTPAPLDTEPFSVVKKSDGEVTMRKKFDLINYSKTPFHVQIDRTVRILKSDEIWKDLGVSAPENLSAVGYESDNRLTNVGSAPWKKETGLLSIWILGQFNASPDATVLIPFRKGSKADLGDVVESDYFGSVPSDRLTERDGIIYFRVDSHYRSKIGLSGKRALPVLGSYDAAHHLLTIIQCSPPEMDADYVNSLWKQQEHPFSGSAINSYNDGPNDTGKQLGSFYEIESSSPALALSSNGTGSHFQRTIHLYGDDKALITIARQVLGVELGSVSTVFKPGGSKTP